MGRWKLVTNVKFLDYQEARIWCHALLIDMDVCRITSEPIRQIRGVGYGGLSACTFWIAPNSEIDLKDAEGNTVLLSHDGNAYNLGGMIVRATDREGKPLELALGTDNFRTKMVVEDIEQQSPPFGDEIDKRILPHASGQAYPRVEWTLIPPRLNPSLKEESRG